MDGPTPTKTLVGLFEFPAGYDQMSEAEQRAWAEWVRDKVVASRAEKDLPTDSRRGA